MTATASAVADLPMAEHDISIFFNRKPGSNVVGLLQHAVLPSFGLQGGLSLIAYGLARSTNRLDLKDYLWPTGMVLNAWWTAVGRHYLFGKPKTLLYSQKCLLGAVTAWGGRLFYRIAKRSLSRGKDDARYENVKKQPNFWNKASLLFGLEAVFQTAISLPYTLPFRIESVPDYTGAPDKWAHAARYAAAGLFVAGLALETIADWQLDSHKKREQNEEHKSLLRTGVWSIVRHPNYLGDCMIHLAFPLWNFGYRVFTWPQLLGPAANYLFLRWIGGDRENEASQVERYEKEDKQKLVQLELYQLQKHAFWPSVFELGNAWTWVIAGIGATGAAATYLYEWSVFDPVAVANLASAPMGVLLE